MRRPLATLLILVVVALPPTVSGHGTGVHSPNVEDAHHVPAAPVEGQAVSIHLYVTNDTRVESVRAIYCRVERYACAPALLLVETTPTIYDGRIPWNKDFFEGVTQVGYKFEIRYVDGTNETTPLMHYPSRPAVLPAGADTYYYYTLTPAPASPNVSIVAMLLVALMFFAWRRP